MNTNQMHFNQEWAERSEFGERPVVSTFTLALVLGLGVRDTSENAAANLGWSDIKLPKPVFVGDTLWAESEVLDARESKSRPSCGIVSIRTRGINQRREVVIEFVRAFMVFAATLRRSWTRFRHGRGLDGRRLVGFRQRILGALPSSPRAAVHEQRVAGHSSTHRSRAKPLRSQPPRACRSPERHEPGQRVIYRRDGSRLRPIPSPSASRSIQGTRRSRIRGPRTRAPRSA